MHAQPLSAVIPWQHLDGLEHLAFKILHIDDDQQRAEVLFQFEAHQPIILHRHRALNKTLVLEGQHIIYRPDGEIEEVRPTGQYTVIEPSEEPHSESGGNGGAIVLFSIFDNGGLPLYELLDDQQNIVASLSMTDLVALRQPDG
ncbi:hypothetical protein ACFVYJ_01860 [Pontibacter sp. JAM-7]|uniref:hypothetical protein n=1 Tax=Pontibacter sp. JAM-7 TaxID=3366581 RepID=UPI003AF750AF